ncbi:hypothetical protein HK097_005066, partial [Rhizophlyctis rosea]
KEKKPIPKPPTLPTSDLLASILTRLTPLTRQVTSDTNIPILTRAEKAAESARNTQFVSDSRWSHHSAETKFQESFDNDSQLRRDALQKKNNKLYDQNRWEEVNRLQEVFDEEEKRVRDSYEVQKLERAKGGFFGPVVAELEGMLIEVWTSYEFLLRAGDGVDFRDLDAVEAEVGGWDVQSRLRILQSAFDAAEGVVDEIANVEDELYRQEVQLETSRCYARNDWETAGKLDQAREAREKDRKRVREGERVERWGRLCEGVDRVLMQVRAVVERDRAEVSAALEGVLVGVEAEREKERREKEREKEEEERREKEGKKKDDGGQEEKKVFGYHVPSEELVKQLDEASGVLESLTNLLIQTSEFHQRTFSSHRRAQHHITRDALYDSQNWSGASSLDDSFNASETSVVDSLHSQTTAMREIIQPLTQRVATVRGDHSERESLNRVAAGGGDFASAYAEMMNNQLKTQMISNMMQSMHFSRMSVINNIGSSNTQWVVRRY